MASPPVPAPGSFGLKVMNVLTAANALVYRVSGGRIGGKAIGAPVLLLDHVGRKSGQQRTTPLCYFEDGENLVIVASRGGSDATPAWWLNLREAPETTVQVGRERRAVVARQASPEEKERLWAQIVQTSPDFDVYQGRTERDIPVILLQPAG